MNTIVLPVTDVSAIPMSLLLSADPGMEPAMDYLHKANFFGSFLLSRLIAICALMETSPESGQIISISVNETQRNENIVRDLVKGGIKFAKSSQWKSLYIESSNSSVDMVKIYQSMGFQIESVDHGFFTRNQRTPMMEHGIRCTDKIRLKLNI